MIKTLRYTLVLAITVLVTAFAPAEEESELTPMQKLFIIKEIKPDVERVGIIWNDRVNREELLKQIQRASTSLGIQIFLAPVSDLSNIATQFRTLTRDHNVQALWIVENDDIVSSATGRSFLIKNSLKAGVPMFAPTEDWVNEGACVAMKREGEEVVLVVNKAAASALSITIPEKYLEKTQFLAAN